MSNFNFAPVNNTLTVSFYLNLAKRQDERETVIGFCHNGMLICSPENDRAWTQFSIVSDKQGWVPMELNFQGQTKKVDPAMFWSKLFGCETVEEVPNVKIKFNLGEIDAAEEMYSQGGCLKVSISIDDINILGEQEYNGESSLYLRINPIEMTLVEYYGTKIQGDWVKTCLAESIVDSTNSGAAGLAKYKRAAKKQEKRAAVEAAKANAPEVVDATNNALLDL